MSSVLDEALPLLDSPSGDPIRDRPIRGDGRVWSFCPAHPDGTKYGKRSLSLHPRYGIKCFAECEFGAIMRALRARVGVHPVRQRPTATPPSHTRRSEHLAQAAITGAWPYYDETESLLFRIVRSDPGKLFRQQHPDGAGPCCPAQQCKAAGEGWRWGRGDARYVLYRLPELVAADPNSLVFIGEGEGCVDVLVQHGFIATTSAGGAGKWKGHGYAASLEGRRIVILPDNDPPGAGHAEDIIIDLLGAAAEVRCVILPGLPFKGDVVDWMQAGRTAEAMLELVAAAPVLRPPSAMFPRGVDTRVLAVAGASG